MRRGHRSSFGWAASRCCIAFNSFEANSDGTEPNVVVPRLAAVLERFETAELSLVMSGVPVIVEQIRRNLFRDLQVFSLASLLLFGLLAALIYRNMGIVAGALTSCVTACAATLLLTQAIGIQIGLLTAKGRVLVKGKRLCTAEGEVFAGDKQVAKVTVTFVVTG